MPKNKVQFQRGYSLLELSYKNHLRLSLYYRAIELLELSHGIATQSQSP